MRSPRNILAAAIFLTALLAHAADAVPDALKQTAAKAEAGEAAAMVELARAYEAGTEVRKNLVAALGWYRKAADGGDEDAAGKAGEMFEKGQGTKPDPVLALRYYLQGGSAEGADAAIQRLVAADPQLPKKLEAVAPPETQATLAKAAQGEAAARYDLAEMLFGQTGGLMRDENEGLRLMQLSADQGYAAAQAWMGEAYGAADDGPTRLKGERYFGEDRAKAIEWLKKAAAQGHPGASYSLAGAYERGEGVERNFREAWRLYDVAAKADVEWAEGQRDILATEHPEAADGAAGDAARAALTETRKKAEAGDPAAAYVLWEQYEKTRQPTGAETGQALAWLKKAADGQQPAALLALSHGYRDGAIVPADKAEAVRLLRAAAEKGSTDAAYELGLALRDGDGVEKNALEAFRWLHRAAKNKHAEAAKARDALLSYELSQAVIAAAPPETQELLKRGHDGDVKVRYQVGLLFLKGDGGLPPDMLEARNWLQLAADAGLPEAEYTLGQFVSQGRLERPDWATAAGWYRKAADQGNADAQLALGYCYAAGLGVGQDLDQAGNWWRKAAAQGKTEAAGAIAEEEKDGHVFKDVAVEAMDEFTVLERKYGAEVPAGMKGETRKNFLLQAGTFNNAAVYEIALAYLNGKPEDGVAKDAARGEMWMKRAADSRHPDALAYFEDKANRTRKEEAAKRVAAFEEAFAFAPTRHQRTELIKAFSQAMKNADLADEEKLDRAMAAIAARAKERPDEAFEYVTAIAGFTMSRPILEKYLGADLAARTRAEGQKYLDDFNNPNSPSQQEWRSLSSGITSRAAAGDADAQYQLAEFYLSAPYHRDEGEAIEWLTKAKAGGNAAAGEALTKIGALALQRGRQALNARNQPEALRQFLLADELGVRDEEDTIGHAFETGWIGEANYTKAAEWYRRAADHGEARGLTSLGRLYEGGRGFPPDPAQAAKLYREAGEKGDSAGMAGYARALLLGLGVGRDEGEAIAWFKQAADKKVAVAIQWLRVLSAKASTGDRAELALQTAGTTFYEEAGDIFIEPGDLLDYAGALGSAAAKEIRAKWKPLTDWPDDQPEYKAALAAEQKKDFKQAFALYREAAKKGNPVAMRSLAVYHTGGMADFPENLDEAERWFEKAGEGGLVSGWVGARAVHAFKIYRTGDAARQAGNMAEALRQWKIAADMGESAALREMGSADEEGVKDLVTADLAAARGWFERMALFAPKDGAAELKRIDARLVGRAEFLRGSQAREDKAFAEAVSWYEKAVALGNSDAMEHLAYCYEAGEGVTADVEKAKALYQQAKALGDTWAAEALDDLVARQDGETLKKSLQEAQALTDVANGVSVPAAKAAEPERPMSESELKAKAEAGDALAQYDYGELLKKKGDTAGASEWFHKALENPAASEEVKKWADYATIEERLRAKGQADRDAKEAAKRTADAAEKEKKEAWAKLHPADGYYGAFDFWRHSPTFRDDALKNLYAAAKVAETGTPEIRYRLAEFILQGKLGVPKDEARGRALVISSAEEGFVPARLAYATGLLTGQAGFAVDAPKGRAMLAELVAGAESLMPEAKHQVALLLFQGGYGVAADKARALKLLEKNADDGFVLSQFEFGRALLTGVPSDLAADPVRGVTYLKRVANRGVPEAMALLGQVYERGVGAVAANPAEALTWYEQAEKAGVTQAEAAADRVRPQAQAKAPDAAAKK